LLIIHKLFSQSKWLNLLCAWVLIQCNENSDDIITDIFLDQMSKSHMHFSWFSLNIKIHATKQFSFILINYSAIYFFVLTMSKSWCFIFHQRFQTPGSNKITRPSTRAFIIFRNLWWKTCTCFLRNDIKIKQNTSVGQELNFWDGVWFAWRCSWSKSSSDHWLVRSSAGPNSTPALFMNSHNLWLCLAL